MIIGLGTSIFCANVPNSGEFTPSTPVLVSAAVIGWQGAGDGHVGDIIEIATVSVWTGAATVAQQWQSFNGSEWADISGATGATYTIVEADFSAPIRLIETATNGVGDTVADPSNILTALAQSDPGNTVAPIIVEGSGTADLTSLGEWNGNPAPDGYTRQWQYYISGVWIDNPGATGNSTGFTGGVGDTVRCVVTAFAGVYQGSKESNVLS